MISLRGEKQTNDEEKSGNVLYQGIAARNFERSFQLADHVQVKGASLENGLLHTVLVHGASGGVGIAAVQIARAMGLKVLGTAGTPKGLELAKREGAHQVFDHRKSGYQEEILQATGNRGVDIILEMLANVNLSHDTRLLANNGRVVVIGSRGEVTINPRELMGRRASIRAFTLWGITPEEEADIHAGLFAGLDNDTLRPIVGKELPLAEAARAHKEILEGGSAGKIVLVC
jgi:NADPH:quinone reductase